MATAAADVERDDGHPDVFPRDRAARYLRLPREGTIDWLIEKELLRGEVIGKEMMFHRDELDACVRRMFGLSNGPAQPSNRRQALKLAGGGR